MVITYIEHSGFLIEWEACYWLFDYYKGSIPVLALKKKLFIFASHNHGDHYNPEIFELRKQHPEVEYILSSDIKLKKEHDSYLRASDKSLNKILSVKPSQDYELMDTDSNKIMLKTLKSTDSGVAFLLKYQGKTIYHAGDLNLWVWKEETKQYNNDMTARFHKELSSLKDIVIDLAFVPLDPRQEEWYYLGIEELLNTAKVKYVFPMHFWGKPEIIQQYKQERSFYTNNAVIMDIEQEGQTWNMEI